MVLKGLKKILFFVSFFQDFPDSDIEKFSPRREEPRNKFSDDDYGGELGGRPGLGGPFSGGNPPRTQEGGGRFNNGGDNLHRDIFSIFGSNSGANRSFLIRDKQIYDEKVTFVLENYSSNFNSFLSVNLKRFHHKLCLIYYFECCMQQIAILLLKFAQNNACNDNLKYYFRFISNFQ